ncbi:hypothetical protein EDD22DRAFT_951116 [Suillus occidentalis]|nr:hypothetical protein EDD22DRAFT_951116 [Suillus occidentalis]
MLADEDIADVSYDTMVLDAAHFMSPEVEPGMGHYKVYKNTNPPKKIKLEPATKKMDAPVSPEPTKKLETSGANTNLPPLMLEDDNEDNDEDNDNDNDANFEQMLAAELLKEWAFLYEDPEVRDPGQIYWSKFMLEMIEATHLNAVAGFLNVPAINTDDLQLQGVQAVIAACAASLKRAFNFVSKPKTLDDDQSIATGSAKGSTKSHRMIPLKCNKSSNKDVGTPAFSEANCGLATTDYYQSLTRQGPKYTIDTITMVQQRQEAIQKLKNAPAEDVKPKCGILAVCSIPCSLCLVLVPFTC